VALTVLRGAVPESVEVSGSGSGSGSGYGYGYGSGDGSGSGYGYGDGSGSGYGDGDGYGSGSGYGYGDGYGDGYGYGDGDGYGYGYGYGYGDGYGYGYGSGDGSGYGDGDGDAALRVVARAALPRQYASDSRVLALWKSTAEGKPANGGKADAVVPGLIQREQGPLNLCHAGTLHATLEPSRWKGERLWIVALGGEVIGDAEKLGALEREIICEVAGDR
jgi:hypothetical protein